MPVVIVEMWQGRTEEQKATLIKGITKVFKDIGVPADWLHIISTTYQNATGAPAENQHPKQTRNTRTLASTTNTNPGEYNPPCQTQRIK